MANDDFGRRETNLHWSQTSRAGVFASIFGAVFLGIVTITSFTSGDVVWGFIMLVVLVVALVAFALRLRRERQNRNKA